MFSSLGTNTCRRVSNHLTSMKTNEHQDPDGRAITVDLVGQGAEKVEESSAVFPRL